jgi:glycosyltransferase involved in cell wall biosynthesis
MTSINQIAGLITDAPHSRDGVTIVIPVYNEENGVAGVMERLAALDIGAPKEILAVNDGSTDATAGKLAEAEAKFEELRVVTHKRNLGYGAALKTGFSQAKNEIVVITDADGTYPEDRIRELLDCVDDGAEMAVGARVGENVHIPLIRRPAKAALRHLASFLAGTHIPDLNSGLRAFQRSHVTAYKPILPNGFSFTTTITLASLTNNHRVDYIDIDYAHRSGNSKIRPIADTALFIALIIRTVVYFNPLKVFYPVATLLFFGLIATLANDLFFVDEPNLSDKTVLMFVAFIQILSVGLLADLIEKKARL